MDWRDPELEAILVERSGDRALEGHVLLGLAEKRWKRPVVLTREAYDAVKDAATGAGLSLTTKIEEAPPIRRVGVTIRRKPAERSSGPSADGVAGH